MGLLYTGNFASPVVCAITHPDTTAISQMAAKSIDDGLFMRRKPTKKPAR
jgi:hypothetical protein